MPPTAITTDIVHRLSEGRWLIPILAVMTSEPGSRFGVLVRRLAISRSILSASLDTLERNGWIARNAGHGHPLRPEYLLTAAGRPIAAWCGQVMAQRERLGIERGVLGRWSLPLLFELGERRRRFSELRQELAPVTPRALSITLQRMLDIDLVEHGVAALSMPLYGLSPRGRDFAAPLAPPRAA